MNYSKENLIKYSKYLIKWLSTYIKKNNFNGVCLGVSGGIDSALTLYLVKKALENKYIALFLPINSSKKDYKAVELLNQKNFNIKTIDLKENWANILKLNNNLNLDTNKLQKNNLKSRLRMVVLYSISQSKNYLVIGSSNKLENKLGYYTKFGDNGYDINLLFDLNKTQIYQLAKYYKVEEYIVNRKPTSGLDELTDEKELGFSYKTFEKYLNKETIEPKKLKAIKSVLKKNKHKKKAYHLPKDLKYFFDRKKN